HGTHTAFAEKLQNLVAPTEHIAWAKLTAPGVSGGTRRAAGAWRRGGIYKCGVILNGQNIGRQSSRRRIGNRRAIVRQKVAARALAFGWGTRSNRPRAASRACLLGFEIIHTVVTIVPKRRNSGRASATDEFLPSARKYSTYAHF